MWHFFESLHSHKKQKLFEMANPFKNIMGFQSLALWESEPQTEMSAPSHSGNGFLICANLVMERQTSVVKPRGSCRNIGPWALAPPSCLPAQWSWLEQNMIYRHCHTLSTSLSSRFSNIRTGLSCLSLSEKN